MSKFRITGDTLTAFGIEIELEPNPNLENEEIREAIAREIGLEDYRGSEDFRIDDMIELDAAGNEIHVPPAQSTRLAPIDENYAQRQQGRVLTRLYDVNHRKVRVTVHSDTYAFQSYARAELFDGTQWHSVATTEYGLMTSAGKCNGSTEAKHDPLLAADGDEVLRKALVILG